MTAPARQHHKQQVYAQQWRQIWIVAVCLPVGCVLAFVLSLQVVPFATGLTAGALVQFFAQSVFTFVAYRSTGAKARQRIMLNMYLGVMLKWTATVLGFMVIFIVVRPLYAWSVFLGYVAMLLVSVAMTWKIR